MTKEELKQQFYKYIKDHEDYFDPREPWTERIILQIWLDCAEPREKQIAELEDKLANADYQLEGRDLEIKELEKENTELKELIEKYRQAVDKCLHITFMGGGCEVNTIGQYATLVDGYLTDVEGLAKWKN